MTRPWAFRPGQHLFISIPAVDFGTSHPFSVAWSECDASLLAEKSLKLSQSGQIMPEFSPISLIISRRKGFTNRLYQKVAGGTFRNMTFQACVQGPFGGLQPLDSYGTIVLICGGVGITHMTSYLPHLVAGYANATAAVQRLSLVWVVPTWDNLEWIRPWVKTILDMERCAEVLQVRIHITRPESGSVVRYQTNPIIQINKGRPDVCQILDEEISQQIGAMAVMVCSPGSLSDIVRQECRLRQTSRSNIEFFEEGFSW
jgi:predicted ferric reductase